MLLTWKCQILSVQFISLMLSVYLVTSEEISKATYRDPVLSQSDYVRNGWPAQKCSDFPENIQTFVRRQNELSTDSGCLLWGNRVVIPPRFQDRLLNELHSEHMGVCRTKAVARSYFWWPGLDGHIENLIAKCSICQSVKNNPPLSPTMPWKFPICVWQRVHVDFCEKDSENFLVVIDAYSKWIEIVPMKSTTSLKTIDVLRSLFASYGICEELVSDNGPQFISAEFATFVRANGIKHTLVPPYSP